MLYGTSDIIQRGLNNEIVLNKTEYIQYNQTIVGSTCKHTNE